MESHIANESEYEAIGQAYWDLADPTLLCSPTMRGPDMGQIRSGTFTPIVCIEDDGIIGVVLIKNANNGVYYPVMKGDFVAVLRSMCACAQDNFDSLVATTDNQFIHDLAVRGGLPFEYVDDVIVWSK